MMIADRWHDSFKQYNRFADFYYDKRQTEKRSDIELR